MGLSDAMKSKIAQTLAQGNVATREDLLENKDMVLVVSPDYLAYSNLRITQAVDGLTDAEVTHLKSLPMVEDGIVVLEAATKGEVGAEEFLRGETRRFGKFNFRAGLNKFNLEWPDNRNLLLPVTEDEIPMPEGGTRKVLVVTVKQPTTKERAVRKKKGSSSPAPTTPTPVTNSAAGSQAGTQPGAQAPEGEKKV